MSLLTASFLLLTGCSFERNLKLDARLPHLPAVKQMPVHIGLYYSPEFVKYARRIELIGCGPSGRRDRWGIYFVFPVGAASEDLFDQVIASMFSTVTSTSGPSQSSNNVSSVDGFLVPQIESFDWDTVCSKDFLSTGKFTARVTYVINFYSRDGLLVSSMRVEGLGTEKPRLCFSCKDSLATEQAMQNAMAKFMIEFPKQPEVKQWLSTHVPVPGNHQ
jgi:hypothetical protein